ncbi:hypothetical protein EH165_02685 [Nakamurella antarctica]|uniref:Uncharacterized protein n=1 Tax=Nakamurella antarctica TaxID=1902245 RepID=A0A3G8ZT44_9ACTN|nr:hypothetical protein [Nakamurella antarctica]AZI57226.1 hypothetical protein EH165_02685 [Nakamurella antarctica]
MIDSNDPKAGPAVDPGLVGQLPEGHMHRGDEHIELLSAGAQESSSAPAKRTQRTTLFAAGAALVGVIGLAFAITAVSKNDPVAIAASPVETQVVDVRWGALQLPAPWTVVAADELARTWRYGESSCGLTLTHGFNQLPQEDARTAQDVVDYEVKVVQTFLPAGTDKTVLERKGTTFPVEINGTGVTQTLEFDGARVAFYPVNAEAQVYSYVDGGRDINVIVLCTGAQFAKNYDVNFAPVITDLILTANAR